MTAEGSGFDKSSVQVGLDVEQRREVNFSLNISGVSTTVNVEAVAPAINTTSGEIGGVVQGRHARVRFRGEKAFNLTSASLISLFSRLMCGSQMNYIFPLT